MTCNCLWAVVITALVAGSVGVLGMALLAAAPRDDR